VVASEVNDIATPAEVAALDAPRRPRGRPRKTLDERDEGNRRQQLIHAAARLFRSKGFAAASTRDIAAAVGMQSGSPFYHFKSKGALLYEVMEQGMRSALSRQQQTVRSLWPNQTDEWPLSAPDRARRASQEVPPDGPDTQDARAHALRALIRTHFEILLGPDSDFIPVMLYEWRSLSTAQRAAIVALQHDYEAPWLPVLGALHAEGCLHTEVHLARLLILGALNWSVQWYSPGQGASLEALTDAAMSLFVHAPDRR